MEKNIEKRLGEEGKGRDKKEVGNCALILAPHPDDESITGLLPLRLHAESGFRIWVVPATLGSRIERQADRRKELKSACSVLGFGVRFFGPGEPAGQLSRLLERLEPTVVFIPHARDGHPTHQATHRLGIAAMDAVRRRTFHVVETEYWHPLERPNLMVAALPKHLLELRRALACHKGELARNDYAARLPAWMCDNVRRGAELIGGLGARAPDFAHATLYRARKRKAGKWCEEFRGGRVIYSSADLKALAKCWTEPMAR
jgi:N-acetylglucosamine malate deacetylase 1